MNHTDQLLNEIEAFLGRTGMAATTFGQKAILNSKLVDRLRKGGTVTLQTAETIRDFMAEKKTHVRRSPRKGNAQAVAA